MNKKIKEVKKAIELARGEIKEWKDFLKLAKERLKKLCTKSTEKKIK